MPTLDLEVTCPVFDSFRVQQVGGMFDVPLAQRAKEHFKVELPEWLLEERGSETGQRADWQIGLIVGPSGSGKTTVARAIFGERVYRPRDWPPDRAVIDGFGQRPIKNITHLLTAVGFSSPPSWIKPYRVLSNGEQFRCDLARALAGEQNLPSPDQPSVGARRGAGGEGTGEGGQDHSQPALTLALSQRERGPDIPVVVFDEFTSVVDRNVARVVSAAIAKGIRGGRIGCRFVAVTCHYDIAEWLAPDWVIDMAAGSFQRRSLRRPPIDLQLVRCRRSAWRLFARHHYLSGNLPQYVRCFLALWEGMPVAFCATVSLIGRKNRWRISRVVALPDYQGVGIGMAVTEAVAELHRAEGHRVNLTGSHPAVIAHCRRSPQWKTVGVKKTGGQRAKQFIKNYRGSTGRAVVSFEYVGDGEQRSE